MPPADCAMTDRRQLKGAAASPTCDNSTVVVGSGGGSVPSEPENLPCPRCESTNTKFCYYNNYNLSQPRYFCKSCRRYWTRGGTLRNIPVGGGTRKKHSSSSSSSSSSKRARNNSNNNNNSATSSVQQQQQQQSRDEQQRRREREEEEVENQIPKPLLFTNPGFSDLGLSNSPQHSTVTTHQVSPRMMYGTMFPVVKSERVSPPLRTDMNLNEAASTSTAATIPAVSFTSLLGGGGGVSPLFHQQHHHGGFLGLSGWGLGMNGSSSGFDGLGLAGLGIGKEEWGDVLGVGGGGHEIEGNGGYEINREGGGGSSGGSSTGCNTWHLGGGGGVDGSGGDHGGLGDGGDCFAWSDLAISTPGTGLD